MQTEINECLNVLKKGGIILYPTDTVWGIGCDATNYEAVDKIFKLKKRASNKSMISLVNDFKMLKKFKKPIVSTSANLTGKATPNNFKEINKSILEGVDYVVPLNQQTKPSKPSSIIKIKTNGSVSVIRK